MRFSSFAAITFLGAALATSVLAGPARAVDHLAAGNSMDTRDAVPVKPTMAPPPAAKIASSNAASGLSKDVRTTLFIWFGVFGLIVAWVWCADAPSVDKPDRGAAARRRSASDPYGGMSPAELHSNGYDHGLLTSGFNSDARSACDTGGSATGTLNDGACGAGAGDSGGGDSGGSDSGGGDSGGCGD